MKKFLVALSVFGVLMLGVNSCQQEQKQPEKTEVAVQKEEPKVETTVDPNDFTKTPLAGEIVSLDNAVKNDNAVLTPESAKKIADQGGLLVVSANGKFYMILNKADNSSAIKNLAEMAGKKVNFFGMAKEVNGINFFMMEKMEEVK